MPDNELIEEEEPDEVLIDPFTLVFFLYIISKLPDCWEETLRSLNFLIVSSSTEEQLVAGLMRPRGGLLSEDCKLDTVNEDVEIDWGINEIGF